jgi:hypothetical protein
LLGHDLSWWQTFLWRVRPSAFFGAARNKAIFRKEPTIARSFTVHKCTTSQRSGRFLQPVARTRHFINDREEERD